MTRCFPGGIAAVAARCAALAVIALLGPAAAFAGDGAAGAIRFERVIEPRERAFSVLVPEGWQTRGGILRIDPLRRGGPAQSIAAKVDFAVIADDDATVGIRWLPDTLYFDSRFSPAASFGAMRPGSQHQGMTVMPLTDAARFTRDVLLPALHPRAAGLRVTDQRPLPGIAAAHTRLARQHLPAIDFSHDAAGTIVEYDEDGMRFRETIFVLVENWGRAGAGLWGTRDVVVARAPAGRFEEWQPVLAVVQGSVVVDRRWLAGEIRGQIERGEILARTQAEIERIGREITEHRQRVNAEIHNDMFLTLMQQEEYVNPFTREIETGSNQWRRRWINPDGQVIYTNDEDYDPNVDLRLNRSDYRRTPVRPRFPQSQGAPRALPY